MTFTAKPLSGESLSPIVQKEIQQIRFNGRLFLCLIDKESGLTHVLMKDQGGRLYRVIAFTAKSVLIKKCQVVPIEELGEQFLLSFFASLQATKK